MGNRVEILNLEWCSFSSRDRQMSSLVCNYLRYLGYSVVEGSVFNGYRLIEKYRPKLFFISNAIGAKANMDLIRYAYAKGIPIVTLISEGNFREKNILDFLWGWNREKKLYENVHLQWSERTKKMTLKHFPKLENKVKVSGGVGFDIYKILRRSSKEDFLNKYKKASFKKVIGIGCWDFGVFFEKDSRFKYKTRHEVNYFRKERFLFNKVLIQTIQNNPQILFLVKEHPGCQLGYMASGIEGAEKFKNVLILKHEESIFDCMNVTDFWITYESTTALEGWLMEKQTCLLNPQGGDFVRDEVSEGSPIYKNEKEVQNVINKFYRTGKLDGFSEREKVRKHLIKETIQWDDGLNHVRAGNEIVHVLEMTTLKKRERFCFNKFLKKRIKQFISWNFSPYLKFFNKFNYHYENRNYFDKNRLRKLQESYYKSQISFYNKINLNKEQLKSIKCQ